MGESDEPPRAAGGKGCGCFAALAFLIVVGLPVLFVFSFGLSPCEDGPCDPNGERNLQFAAAVLLVLAVLVGLGAWRMAAWRNARRSGKGAGTGLELAAALLLLGAAAVFALIFA